MFTLWLIHTLVYAKRMLGITSERILCKTINPVVGNVSGTGFEVGGAIFAVVILAMCTFCARAINVVSTRDAVLAPL